MRYFFEPLKSIGKILMVMYGITAILLLMLALLVSKFQWEEGPVSIGVGLVYVIACLIGGFLAGKVQKTKKFLWGILVGLMYMMVLLVITLIFKHGFYSTVSGFVGSLLLCLGSGMIGGMVS